MTSGEFTEWVMRLAHPDDFEKNRHQVLQLKPDQWGFYILLLKHGYPIAESISYLHQLEALEINSALTREEILWELEKLGPLPKSIAYAKAIGEAGDRGYKAGEALRKILINQPISGLTTKQVYEQLQRELTAGH